VGAGLSIVARDQYGIVQAIERRGDPFLVGVQWHPEFMFFNRRQQRLFAPSSNPPAPPAALEGHHRIPTTCCAAFALEEAARAKQDLGSVH
jgi:hypothetical protein